MSTEFMQTCLTGKQVRKGAKALFILILFLASWNTLLAQRAIPPHGGVWVHDEAGVLDAQTKAELEYALKAERDSTSNQIAVLLISSLEDDDIDLYANRVFAEWKLGTAEKDNGVLFLIAMNDKKMRIEVGQGLEGALTDALSSRINRNEVAPYFRQGNYNDGVKAGVLAVIKAVQGEYTNDDPPTRRGKKRSPWVTLIVIVIFIIMASRRNKGGGGGYMSRGGWIGPVGGGGFGSSSGSWGDFGGGGISGGGGSSDSW
jgi:uncharacterized protein